jgi:molybdate transport system regulatory protein
MEGTMATGVSSAISARNQISGTVANIRSGAAMSLVSIVADRLEVTAAITNQAVQELGLQTNDSVLALVKSTEVLLMTGDTAHVKISARNKVSGQVAAIQRGSAMGSVTIDVGSMKLTSAITRQAIDELQLEQGQPVTAVFKATEVMLLKA